MLKVEGVTVAYPGSQKPVLEDISLHIPKENTLVLLGASGCGKSTLLKAILRLIPLTGGRILLNGEDITAMPAVELRRRIGIVFQQSSLFPHWTIAENIALVPRLMGWPRSRRLSRAEELLCLVGLDAREFAHRLPATLSGGQRQRVNVARALAAGPSFLLMDEPFGALDALTRRAMQDEVKRIRQQFGVTILFVTHDITEAARLGDTIAVMDQGQIVQQGTLRTLYENPAAPAVEDLVVHPLRELDSMLDGGFPREMNGPAP